MTNSPLNLPTLAAAVAGLSPTDGFRPYEVSSICKGRQMAHSHLHKRYIICIIVYLCPVEVQCIYVHMDHM